METVLAVVTLALSGVSSLFRTWVIAVGWGYKVTPTYGIPVPPLPVIYGVLLIVGVATLRMDGHAERAARKEWERYNDKRDRIVHAFAQTIGLIFGSAFYLVLMWLVYAFTH